MPDGQWKWRVLKVLRRIPPGRVMTYGDVARAAGRPGAARAVGNIMRAATAPGLPYHRVVAAGGRGGGDGGRPELKAALLRAEGLIVRGKRIVQFEQHRWPSATPRSAGALRARGAGVGPRAIK
jgi:methylated-DNA-[protein]-cysteine S-methyltransferase